MSTDDSDDDLRKSSDYVYRSSLSLQRTSEGETEVRSVDPRTLLTDDQIQRAKEMFALMDPQGVGVIPTKMLGLVLRNIGLNPTNAAIKEYMADADPDGKGLMDFHGFLLPIAKTIAFVPESVDDIMGAFAALDESQEGYIKKDVLYEYLTTLGERLNDEEADLLIKLADPKGEGKVNYVEFVERSFGVVRKKSTDKGGKKDKKKKK